MSEGAWRTREVTVAHPCDILTTHTESYYDETAVANCATCADYGSWIGADDCIEPCPDCEAAP